LDENIPQNIKRIGGDDQYSKNDKGYKENSRRSKYNKISEDLWYLVQSNDELDGYKERGNFYVDKNIQEIQKLYANEEQQKKEKGKIKEEVILIKP